MYITSSFQIIIAGVATRDFSAMTEQFNKKDQIQAVKFFTAMRSANYASLSQVRLFVYQPPILCQMARPIVEILSPLSRSITLLVFSRPY